MSGLVHGLKRGDAWAVTLLLKCKAGFRETSAHEISTPTPIVHVVNMLTVPEDEKGEW